MKPIARFNNTYYPSLNYHLAGTAEIGNRKRHEFYDALKGRLRLPATWVRVIRNDTDEQGGYLWPQ